MGRQMSIASLPISCSRLEFSDSMMKIFFFSSALCVSPFFDPNFSMLRQSIPTPFTFLSASHSAPYIERYVNFDLDHASFHCLRVHVSRRATNATSNLVSHICK